MRGILPEAEARDIFKNNYITGDTEIQIELDIFHGGMQWYLITGNVWLAEDKKNPQRGFFSFASELINEIDVAKLDILEKANA